MDFAAMYCLEKFTLPKWWCLQGVQNRSGPDHAKEMLGSGLCCCFALLSLYLFFVSKARQHVAHPFTRGDGDDVTILSPCFIE